MRVRFALNLLFVLSLNLLVKPLWIFGVDRQVQNLCGATYYGTFFAVYSFSFLFHILLDFGLNHLNNTQASRDNAFIKENLSSIIVLKVFLSIAYFLLTIGLAYMSGFSGQQMSWLMWLGVNLILLNFILFFRSSIASAQKFILDGFLSVLDRLLSVIFCFYLIYFQSGRELFDLDMFVKAQSLALFISVIVSGAAVLTLKIRLHWVIDIDRIKDIFNRSIPFAIQGLLMIMYYRLDGVLLERLPIQNGAYHAGIYAASYRLYEAATMVPYLFSTLLLPMFARMLSSGEDVKPLLRLSGRLIFLISSATCIIGLFESGPIIQFLYPNSDYEWARVFSIMMITFLPVSMVYIHGTLLLATMDLRSMNKVVAIGLLINIVLNLILIPLFQSSGVQWQMGMPRVDARPDGRRG